LAKSVLDALSTVLLAASFVTVRLLELELGREEGSIELSRLKLLGLESVFGSVPYVLPRLLSVEFCLLKVVGTWALHLLLTLSLRFSIALCTKPPMPLVGDEGRSGDILPWVGDMASPRTEPVWSPPFTEDPCSEGGANFCESNIGSGDFALPRPSTSAPATVSGLERRALRAVLPRKEVLERTLSGGGLVGSVSTVVSLDKPGSCLLPDMEPVSDALSS
jgi:hypothetical protein